MESMRAKIGDPPVRDGAKVFTKRGRGKVEKSTRTPKGICLYEVKLDRGGRDVFDHSEMQQL